MKPGEARRGEERRRGNAEIESTTRGAASVFRSTSENRGRPIKTYSRTSLVKTLTLFSPPPPRLEQVDFAINITRLRFFFPFLIDIDGGNCRSAIIKSGKKGWLSGIKLFRWCECRFPKRIKRKGGKGGGSMNRKGPKLREKCDVIVFYVMELNASLLPFCHAQGEAFFFSFFLFFFFFSIRSQQLSLPLVPLKATKRPGTVAKSSGFENADP